VRGSYRERISAVTGAQTDDEIDSIIKEIRNNTSGPIRKGIGAVINACSDDDLRDHWATVTAGSAERAAADRNAAAAEHRKGSVTQSRCDHGVGGGWLIRPLHGDPYCASCRRGDYAHDPDAFLLAAADRMDAEGIVSPNPTVAEPHRVNGRRTIPYRDPPEHVPDAEWLAGL
jgi:hypothetical protein